MGSPLAGDPRPSVPSLGGARRGKLFLPDQDGLLFFQGADLCPVPSPQVIRNSARVIELLMSVGLLTETRNPNCCC